MSSLNIYEQNETVLNQLYEFASEAEFKEEHGAIISITIICRYTTTCS